MLDRLKRWLFPTTFELFDLDAIDRDKDGIVNEGTPFERKLATSVSKKPAKKPVKKAPAKKPAKKAPAKKAPAKKPVKKKAAPKKTASKKTKKVTKKK